MAEPRTAKKTPSKRTTRKGSAAKKSGPGNEPAVLRLDAIVGNARARSLLERAVAEGRLFPSLLFSGPPGVGKLTTARALAASLNCASPAGVQACGVCPSCRKIAGWFHPDVKVLESEAAAGDAGRPVFFRSSAPPDATRTSGPTSRAGSRLLIQQVRNLVRETGFRPFEGKQRVLIVRDLETDPSQSCANVLLKTLEEPPRDTTFVVVTSQPERLPITIHSRCHALSFVPAPRDEVEGFLTARGIDTDEARWRAAWTGGRPGAALRLEATARRASRDALLEALYAAAAGAPAAALAAAEPFSRRGVDLRHVLDDLALVVRDLMVLPDDPERLLIANRDRLAELEQLAVKVPPDRAARLLDRIAWCVSAAERNVSGGLMLQTLFLEAGGHVPDSPLTTPWLPAGDDKP